MVGAGAAGLTAAIAAAEAGAKVGVLEKAPDIQDTNTSRSGGGISIIKERELDPNARRLSAEEKAEEAVRLTDGGCDPSLIKTWRKSIDATIQWLTKAGLKWGKPVSSGIPESQGRVALGAGAGLNKQLLSIAEKKGCEILFNCRAEGLLTDSMGRISGVRTRTVEGIKGHNAAAVVLATGGFQANQELLLRYFGPEFGASFAYDVRLTGSPFSTGDGLLMAQAVGAKLVNLDKCHGRNIDHRWVPGSTCMPGPYRDLQYPIVHHAIWVNKLGRRFMDEVSISDSAASSILKQPGQTVAYIFDENIKNLRPNLVEGFRPPEALIKAGTLEEIAARISIPYQALKATIEEYNDAVGKGKAAYLVVPKSGYAVKIENPPFYAVYPVWFGLNCTLGGPKITGQAQVVDRDDIPIPGLFAAGEMIGGFFSGRYLTTMGGATYYRGNYQVTTASLSTCIVFGRIAGTNAAKWGQKVVS